MVTRVNIEQSAAEPLILEESSTTIPEGSTLYSLRETGDIPKDTTIYGLVDPRDNMIRYVGKTNQELIKRYRAHISDKTRSKKTSWIKRLKSIGLLPKCMIIDRVNNWEEAEKYYIHLFKSAGYNLTNLTEGGKHTIKITAKIKKKMSKTRKGKYPEWLRGTNRKAKFQVKCFNFDGSIYKIYNDLEDAVIEFKTKRKNIVRVCNKNVKSHKNKVWRYIDDNFDNPKSLKSRTIQQFDKSGNLIASFESITQASQHLNCKAPNISRVLRGERNHFRGFIFRYKDIV